MARTKEIDATISDIFKGNREEGLPFAFIAKPAGGQVEYYAYSSEDEALAERQVVASLLGIKLRRKY